MDLTEAIITLLVGSAVFITGMNMMSSGLKKATGKSLRRIFKGQSPFVADAEHIHHKLLHAGFSQKKTVVILTSVAILAGALACLFASHNAIRYDFFLTLALVGFMLLLNLFRVLTKK